MLNGKDAVDEFGEKSSRGAWIQTFTGRAFYPLDPRPEDINLLDIAHALSMQCRFTGHLRRFYSVAEHCCRVSVMVKRLGGTTEEALWGLLHDASEAYLVDVARPVKHTPLMQGYRDAEAGVTKAICQRFGLPPEEPSAVKTADKVMLAIEARDLLGPLRPGWERWNAYLVYAANYPAISDPMGHEDAEYEMLAAFKRLGGIQ